jgi:hypothetical protein
MAKKYRFPQSSTQQQPRTVQADPKKGLFNAATVQLLLVTVTVSDQRRSRNPITVGSTRKRGFLGEKREESRRKLAQCRAKLFVFLIQGLPHASANGKIQSTIDELLTRLKD